MSHPPLNLTARDFDAYAAEKATSNAYSRPRIEVKQRALAWARGVVARLAHLGIAVDVHGSDEHPSLRNKKRVDCQWVFFWRDQAARDELDRLLDRGRSIAAEIDDPSPFNRHAFLALRIDAAAVAVCFAVHPEAQVDVDNLRAQLAEGAATSELMTALHALPEQFAIGVSPDDRVAASAITPEKLRALVERAAADQVPLWVGWSVKRETAIEHSAVLDEQLEDAIVALAPVYHLVAWSRDNDPIALDRRIESAEQERARAHAEAEAQTERWRAEQAEARRRSAEQARPRPRNIDPHAPAARPQAPGKAGRRPSLDTLFAPRTSVSMGPSLPGAPNPGPAGRAPLPHVPKMSLSPPSPSAAHSPNAVHARGLRPAEPGSAPEPPAPPSPRPQAEPDGERLTPPPVIDKGVKVRVLSGPFADKLGVISELDGRGGARVLLGLLSTRLETSDLEPVLEGRERPALQSSHRRPLAPAPRKAR